MCTAINAQIKIEKKTLQTRKIFQTMGQTKNFFSSYKSWIKSIIWKGNDRKIERIIIVCLLH